MKARLFGNILLYNERSRTIKRQQGYDLQQHHLWKKEFCIWESIVADKLTASNSHSHMGNLVGLNQYPQM